MTPLPLIAFLLVGLALDEGPTLPEPVFVVVDKTDTTATFSWHWTGFDANGAPTAADRVAYKFRLEPPVAGEGGSVIVVLLGSVSSGTTSHPVSEILATVPPGRYRLGVQLRGAEGLWSSFSGDLYLEVREGSGPPPDPPVPAAPAAPTELRVERREAPP